ncbi:MAG: class I SAM-dependent methyltransferase [Methanomassiliicoccus sp.]|nr:class I SAM-dependent methyltransferase [Methanomassiliicoccus sp.]
MRTPRKGKTSSGASATSAEVESLDLYEGSARYYDIWHDDYKDDIRYFLDLAERTGGPVLDCMSGTGRVLIPFAQAGYEVTGVDRSPTMLNIAATKVSFLDPKEEELVDMVQSDIRAMNLGRKFKLIFIPYSSFLHLLETKDQEDALKCIHDHLDDDGLFSFAVFSPRLDRPQQLLRHRGTRLTPQGEIISWFEAQTFDQPSQRTTVTYFYDISRQDKPLRRVTSVFTLRYLFHREALELLDRCGFEVVDVNGDYLGGPFKATSEQMLFVARKKR